MIKIVTDSTCCITREFAKQHDIRVIPLKILFSDEEFYEGFPGEYDRFYQKLESSKEIPKTSLPSPEAFAEAFDSIVSQGDEVICITLASALSGTVNSAALTWWCSTNAMRSAVTSMLQRSPPSRANLSGLSTIISPWQRS